MVKARRFTKPLILIALLMLIFSSNWAILARLAFFASNNSLSTKDAFCLPVTEQAVSNLNEDSSVDLIVGKVEGSSYKLEISLTGNNNKVSNFVLDQPNVIGSSFFTCDIDQDNDQDIVVVSPLSNRPIAVWLSDGKGNFQQDKSYTNDGFSTSESDVSQQTHFLAESPISNEEQRLSIESTILSFINHKLEQIFVGTCTVSSTYSRIFSKLITSRGPPFSLI